MNELVVFDTNVFVSYLLPPVGRLTAVKLAIKRVFNDKAIPVFSDEIIHEYADVLGRSKFHFPHDKVYALLSLVQYKGVCIDPLSTNVHFTDITDKPFYDAAVSSDAWLVTGNKRHYPQEDFIVSPREYLERTGG